MLYAFPQSIVPHFQIYCFDVAAEQQVSFWEFHICARSPKSTYDCPEGFYHAIMLAYSNRSPTKTPPALRQQAWSPPMTVAPHPPSSTPPSPPTPVLTCTVAGMPMLFAASMPAAGMPVRFSWESGFNKQTGLPKEFAFAPGVHAGTSQGTYHTESFAGSKRNHKVDHVARDIDRSLHQRC